MQANEWESNQQENEPDVQHQVDDDDDEDEDILDMGDDDQGIGDRLSLLMRFCPNDSSMLYPQVSLKTIMVVILGRLCHVFEHQFP